MTLFPVFHPPCLFVFSDVVLVLFFFGICLVFSTFLFRIVTYLEFNPVRYPCHLSLLVRSCHSN